MGKWMNMARTRQREETQIEEAVPPGDLSAPDWRKAFEELADWTHGMLPDDPRLPATLAAIDGCDAAWLARDWGRFQRHALQVQLLVVSGEPGGLDEQQKWLEG